MLNRIFCTTTVAIGLLLAVTVLPVSAQSFPGQPQRMTNYPQTYVQAIHGEYGELRLDEPGVQLTIGYQF